MKQLTKKTVKAAKEKFPSPREAVKKGRPITAADIEANCADCPKPRDENRSQPTFTKVEFALLTIIVVLVYSWFVSDWLASL